MGMLTVSRIFPESVATASRDSPLRTSTPIPTCFSCRRSRVPGRPPVEFSAPSSRTSSRRINSDVILEMLPSERPLCRARSARDIEPWRRSSCRTAAELAPRTAFGLRIPFPLDKAFSAYFISGYSNYQTAASRMVALVAELFSNRHIHRQSADRQRDGLLW